MHKKHIRNDKAPMTSATFNKTQRVVGAGNQFHSFLCSAANRKYIYLVYCGKLFAQDFHTFPSYILALDWDGNLKETYQFNRWIQSISPSSEQGTFYFTVYADDEYNSARIKLVKVFPQQTNETNSRQTNNEGES